MSHRLIQRRHDAASLERLQQLYSDGLIAPEKKPFLVDLRRSFGSRLAVANRDEFILDGCSQIASLGLGFNAGPMFAPCHHLESWTGDYTTGNIQAIAKAYREFLKRLLGPTGSQYNVQFCSSGAEAIELALGICYEQRVDKSAKRLLAFEGAFHGRMMVALSATWNPKKREPFAWPGYETEFVPYPFIHGENNLQDREDKTIEEIEKRLASGNFFAILLEPMQCEGGDRYTSSTFHQRLIRLAARFSVPLVYDEVQTGFHLGNRFFWHSQFDLRDSDGHPQGPEVIVCAKKSQVGVVISRLSNPFRETFCPASLIRGYAVASMIDQFDDQIAKIGVQASETLEKFVEKYQSMVCNPRSQGLALAFDFVDADTLNEFVNQRFDHGLLYYSAGQRTARFRLSLAYRDQDFDLLWTQLDRCLSNIVNDKSNVTTVKQHPGFNDSEWVARQKSSVASNYMSHTWIVDNKLRRSTSRQGNSQTAVEYLQSELQKREIDGASVVLLDTENYPQYRERILLMQQEVYEPARQSPPKEFDSLFQSKNKITSAAILVLINEQIIAMAFCGPLNQFKQERGTGNDPFLDDESTFYMLDLTVSSRFRGGLGTVMKNAITVLAESRGVSAIHGRNRDRHARVMWAINLGLGGFQTQHLIDDYPDNDSHRDCIYYRMPLRWAEPADADVPFQQLDTARIGQPFIERNMPAMVNKICLSNFVAPEFLDDLEFVATSLPQRLRRLYTASSLSEAVDKIAKALWLKRKPNNRLLTVDGHYFGQGSFLARSLSGVGEPYFETVRIRHYRVVDQLHNQLDRKDWLGFFVQAEQFDGQDEILASCIDACRDRDVPVIFNETGPRFGTTQQFSQQDSLCPDAGVAWLGGQMALSYTCDSFFADDPLLLISTWDGDAYALARFAETMRQLSEVHHD